MEKEIRTFEIVDCDLRATRRGRTIEGLGIVYNKLSQDLGGFREIIKPEAINGVLENSDILVLMNHDESRGVLARSTNGQGSMEAQNTNTGVKYVFEAPDTSLGEEALSGVRRGDIRASSFAFTIAEDGDKWEKQQDETYLRTITKFDKIFDFSLVYRPAYQDTSVAVRSLVDVRTSEAEKATAEAKKKIADLEEELSRKTPSETTDVEADPVDLTEYFKEIEEKIKKM
jgi:HK97 family phage prohead protease